MTARIKCAIVIIACFTAFSVDALAMAGSDQKALGESGKPESYRIESEMPLGPCTDWSPENCVEPKGCTAGRRNKIDDAATDGRYADFLGSPQGDYVEVDDGCKHEFQHGAIYVTYQNSRTKVVVGPVWELYFLLGETSSELGWPRSSEPQKAHENGRLPAADVDAVAGNVAALEHRFRFANGWVYWHPEYDNPRVVMERFHDYFQVLGGVSDLGFPVNEEGPASHDPEMVFQAFDQALIYGGTHGSLSIIQGELFDLYLDAAAESASGGSVEDPVAAEAELGLPTTGYLPTPNGNVRLLHRGTIYSAPGDVLGVFPESVVMLDGRIVRWDENPDDAFDAAGIVAAIGGDPYLADYRKDVLLEAFIHIGLCGDDARDAIGTGSEEYCSEFVREVYQAAGMDNYLCGRRACLWAVTYGKQLRRIFQGNGAWVYGDDADELTPEPGDYLSMVDPTHSALVVATSIDGSHLWRIGGNEGECVSFSRNDFFDEHGVINARFHGFGNLQASFFE
jgi:hypothetical protein